MHRDNVAIQLDDSLQKSFDTFFNFLPNILAFLVILLIGYIVAKIVKGIVTKGLQKAGLDRHLHESDANQYVQRVMPGASPSKRHRPGGVLPRLRVLPVQRHRRLEDPGADHLHEPGARLPAQRDRSHHHLRRRGRYRRRRGRRHRPCHGRHPDRQDRRHSAPGDRHGHRDCS